MSESNLNTQVESAKAPAPYDDFTVPEGFVWTYRATVRGKYLSHEWTLKNDKGGVHVHCNLSEYPEGEFRWMGGIECHWLAAPDYMSPDKPSQACCWLLDGQPCWHDGSSLYFSERIADMLPQPWSEAPHEMGRHVHGYMFHELHRWHRDKIEGAVE